jgi:hypothetical protein
MRPSTILLAVLPFAIASPSEPPAPNWGYLSSLLQRCSPAALHDILHQLSPKFQDGIFSVDTAAIEHVHSEDHVMATKLVHMALKRQNNGTATTSTPPPDSSQESSISSALSQEITATTTPDPTTISVAPTTPAGATPVETVEGGVVFSTIGGGVVTETSRNVGVSFTRSSSTRLITSTAANGDVETLTSVVVVNAPITGSPDSGAAGAAATTNPGLQDAAIAAKASAMLLVAAGLGAAAFML